MPPFAAQKETECLSYWAAYCAAYFFTNAEQILPSATKLYLE